MLYKIVSSIPGLCQLDVSIIPTHTPLICDNQKCPQALTNDSLAGVVKKEWRIAPELKTTGAERGMVGKPLW